MNIWKSLPCLALLLLITLLVGCSPKKSGEVHADGGAKGEMLQITAYSDKTEAFLEFSEPVAGEKGTLLINLTRLVDWKPVPEGAIKLVFTPATGTAVEYTVPAPLRPGVYQAEVTLAAAGEYALAIISQGNDRIEIPELHVVKKGEAHKEHAEDNHAGHADKDGAKGHDEKDAEHGPEEKGEKHAKAEQHAEEKGGHAEEAGHHDEEKDGHHAEEAEHHGEEKGGHHEEAGHHDEAAAVVFGTGGGTIAFTKNQQWATEFMSRPAELKSLNSFFTTMGELVPVSNAEATVSAPLSGIISGKKALPFIGKKVARGEIVAYIEPPVHQEGGIGQLAAGRAEAKNRVIGAQREYDRARRLYEAKIAPLKRVEEAELALSSAKAALEPLDKALESVKGDGGNRIAVRAPVSGTVVEIVAANGRGVEAGQPILRIINTGTLWLKANLAASDAGKASQAAGATFTVTGLEGEFRPTRLVTVNDMLDPQTRTLSVLYEVPNPGGRLKVGMFANVSIRTGAAQNALAVPKESLVEDEGRWFLFVQTAGEAFERREVKVGVQDKGYVQITAGLEDHERVVTKGAYYVKLAATAGKTADPHAGHGH